MRRADAPLPCGEYRYEIRRDGRLIAVEEERFTGAGLSGVRRSSEGGGRFEVEAELDDAGHIRRVILRYARGPFSRSASYQAGEEFLRGALSALGGRSDLVVKLGRFREIDADLMLCKALIIAHARARGQTRFTGRVASLNPDTLAPASHKQTYRQLDADGMRWSCEPRMGDAETIEIDERNVIVRLSDNRGLESRLVHGPGGDCAAASGG